MAVTPQEGINKGYNTPTNKPVILPQKVSFELIDDQIRKCAKLIMEDRSHIFRDDVEISTYKIKLKEIDEIQNSWSTKIINWIGKDSLLARILLHFGFFSSLTSKVDSIEKEKTYATSTIKNVELDKVSYEQLLEQHEKEKLLLEAKKETAASYHKIYDLFGGEEEYFRLPVVKIKTLEPTHPQYDKESIDPNDLKDAIMRFDGGFVIKDDYDLGIGNGPLPFVQLFYIDAKNKNAGTWVSQGQPLVHVDQNWIEGGKIQGQAYFKIKALIEKIKKQEKDHIDFEAF